MPETLKNINILLREQVMSSGTKKQFKQFSIDSSQDACLALGMVISGVIINLEKYKEYADEAEILLENSDAEYIPAKVYDDINDKLLYRQREILKLSADHQSSSFSYIGLRKLYEKKGYLKTSLSGEMVTLLNEMLDVRNWTFHNPQSLMVAAKEAAEKGIPAELKGIAKIVPQLNPIIVQKIDKYELLMLASLTIHTQKRIEQFETVLNSMKSDYQEMFDSIEDKPLLMTAQGASSEVQYQDRFITSQFVGYQSDIAQISMAIQKSKYDGTDNVFNKWVVRLGVRSAKVEDKE